MLTTKFLQLTRWTARNTASTARAQASVHHQDELDQQHITTNHHSSSTRWPVPEEELTWLICSRGRAREAGVSVVEEAGKRVV